MQVKAALGGPFGQRSFELRAILRALLSITISMLCQPLVAEEIGNPYRNDSMLLGFWTAFTIGEGIAATSDTGAVWSGVASGVFSFGLLLNGSLVLFDQTKTPEEKKSLAVPTISSGILFATLTAYTFFDILNDKDSVSRFLKTFLGYNISIAPGFITYQWQF